MGKNFCEEVYEVVRKIPSGSVVTYKDVAIAIGRPNACRAVGNCLNKNRSKKIPCHRVIRSDGFVGGFNRGTKRKIEILKKES